MHSGQAAPKSQKGGPFANASCSCHVSRSSIRAACSAKNLVSQCLRSSTHLSSPKRRVQSDILKNDGRLKFETRELAVVMRFIKVGVGKLVLEPVEGTRDVERCR